jgi:hypothetical protein
MCQAQRLRGDLPAGLPTQQALLWSPAQELRTHARGGQGRC